MSSARIAALLLGLAALACRTSGSAGEFEDDAGSDEGRPPDLPQPACDPRRLDECDEGQKCGYVDDAELGPMTRCVELHGDKLAGESCERIADSDDCAALHLCWGAEADGSGGICMAYCDTGLGCDDPSTLCSVSNDGFLQLCLPRCDPLAQDCVEGWGCYPDPDRRWACDRDRSGALGAHGEPCECLNCCDPGLVCALGATVDADGCGGEGSEGCCAAICEVVEGDPLGGVCPTELERCRAFYPSNDVMVGLEDVGVCAL